MAASGFEQVLHFNLELAVHIDLATDTDAWNLCKSRPDKAWSLVDCSSFITMQRHNIQQALTTDHHFEQAGFIRVLNPSNT